MKKIYIGYSVFTKSLYAFSKKDRGDKQDITEQLESIAKNIKKWNDVDKIQIGNLILQIKE